MEINLNLVGEVSKLEKHSIEIKVPGELFSSYFDQREDLCTYGTAIRYVESVLEHTCNDGE